MAIHSSILALEIPWTQEPGGLHDCSMSNTVPGAGDRVVNQAEPLSSWSLCSFLEGGKQ